MGDLRKIRESTGKVSEHPTMKLIVQVVSIAAGITAVLTFVLVIVLGSKGDTTSGSSSNSTTESIPTTTSPSSMVDSSPATVLSFGACLSLKKEAVSCSVQHAAEVYVVGSHCNPTALLRYLGGVDRVDVLALTVESTNISTSGGLICVASNADEQNLTGSVRNILATQSGDGWRRCLDNRFNREVNCSVTHTDEFVFAGALAPGETLDCSSRAQTYLNAPVERFSGQLTVREATSSGQSGCVVEALGSNLLTASVRRIGVQALPMIPGGVDPSG
jgi:hypothetical protein